MRKRSLSLEMSGFKEGCGVYDFDFTGALAVAISVAALVVVSLGESACISPLPIQKSKKILGLFS